MTTNMPVIRRDRFGSAKFSAFTTLFRRRKKPSRQAANDDTQFVNIVAAAAPSSSSSSSSSSLPCTPVGIVDCSDDPWTADDTSVALNACIGSASIVALDGLVSESQRAALLAWLRGDESANAATEEPPAGLWDRKTADGVGLPPSWGLRQSLLRKLESDPPRCVLEVQSRLCKLYPDYTICHHTTTDADGAAASRTSFVANAATHGDHFEWHVDGDPQRRSSSSGPPLADGLGTYCNGASGRPLLVSLIVYLDAHWQRDWDAETLFLEDGKGVGLLVQPRPARCVLMHQDVLHRVSMPSLVAKRPRYSLVWKLVFVPKAPRKRETICRPEWGEPLRIN